jgi:hypothetical protein
MELNKIVELLEGYEMPCGSGEYDFIHRKDYQAIAKELQQAMNYIPCCTELCDCEIPKPKDPYNEIDKHYCRDCENLIA